MIADALAGVQFLREMSGLSGNNSVGFLCLFQHPAKWDHVSPVIAERPDGHGL